MQGILFYSFGFLVSLLRYSLFFSLCFFRFSNKCVDADYEYFDITDAHENDDDIDNCPDDSNNNNDDYDDNKSINEILMER